jgi:DNA mismatch endonuclease, patch repair protein
MPASSSVPDREPRPPPPSSPAVTHVMRANRGKRTQPERSLRRALRLAGLTGFRLNDKQLPGKPDFAYRAEKVAVFANGCFWHGHSCQQWPQIKSHPEYWAAKFARNVDRDARKAADLERLGWKVLVFWECELNEAPGRCVARVAEALGRGKNQG